MLKKIMNTSFGIAFLFISFLSHAQHTQIVQVSIPKCGTHMLLKCLQLLTNRNINLWPDVVKYERFSWYNISPSALSAIVNLPEDNLWISHLIYTEQYAKILSMQNIANFFIYRDPRDMAISFAFFMKNNPSRWPKAVDLSLDDLIMDIITAGTTFNNELPAAKGIDEFYKKYTPWLKVPHVMHVRFEDLIGELGGGSNEAQFQVIKNITVKLHLDFSDEQIRKVASDLFGNTPTFREGKIGAWKKHFNQKHIDAFKSVAGNLLIDLGYEKDLNW